MAEALSAAFGIGALLSELSSAKNE